MRSRTGLITRIGRAFCSSGTCGGVVPMAARYRSAPVRLTISCEKYRRQQQPGGEDARRPQKRREGLKRSKNVGNTCHKKRSGSTSYG